MCRKFFHISGLSMVLVTAMFLYSATVRAGDGLFSSRVNSTAFSSSNSAASEGLNSAAKQNQSSPAGGAVVTSSPDKSQLKSRAVPFARGRNFIAQSQSSGSNVIAAPNGNTGITGIGLPTSRGNGRLWAAPNGIAKANKIIAAPNGNTGITGAGLPQSWGNGRVVTAPNGIAKASKIIAAPNGNTGFSGAGLPTSSAASNIAMFRDVTAATSLPFQTNRNKLAGGVPMQQIQKGVFGEIGGALSDGASMIGGAVQDAATSIGGPFTSHVTGTGSAPPPTAGNNKVALKPVGTGQDPSKIPSRLEGHNKVALKPVGTGQDPSKIPSRREGAIDFGFESKPAGPNGNGQGTPPTPTPNPNPGGPIGNGTPPTPAPNPNPGGPIGNGTPSTPAPNQYPGNPYPENLPHFPMPYPSVPYPSGPLVISQPSPVIVSQPAPVFEAPTAGVPAANITFVATSADLVLEDIHIAECATLIAGPSYRLKFRNQGTQHAGMFQAALLASLDGTLTNDAPRALVELPGLAAGEAMEVILRLPKSAMQMASATTGQVGEFAYLFLAVDFQNSVAELDETNNIAVLERLALETVDQAVMQQ